MKRLQYLMDQASRTRHMLDLNIDVMKLMVERLIAANEFCKTDCICVGQDVLHQIGQRCSEHRFGQKNIASILHRATILSNQVGHTP